MRVAVSAFCCRSRSRRDHLGLFLEPCSNGEHRLFGGHTTEIGRRWTASPSRLELDLGEALIRRRLPLTVLQGCTTVLQAQREQVLSTEYRVLSAASPAPPPKN